MSTNERAGKLHLEAVNLLVSKSLIEEKPGFRLAAAVVALVDAVVDRDPKREIDELRKLLIEEFPTYRDSLTINGVTHAEIYKFAMLDEELKTTETALDMIIGKRGEK